MNIEFNIPNLPNPGIMTGQLPPDLLQHVKSVVHFPKSRNPNMRAKNPTGWIEEEYDTPKIQGLREYIGHMYEVWCNHFGINSSPYQIDSIQTQYMKAGEYIPNHRHPETLATFVIWVTIPYNIDDELNYGQHLNKTHPSKTSCFEFIYNTYEGMTRCTPIPVTKEMEGTVTMIPPRMMHCFYPFYTSQNERVTVSGKIYRVRD